MDKNEEFLKNIKAELLRKEYKPKTIELYVLWLNKLQKYYAVADLNEVTFKQIKDYIDFLTNRKNSAPRTIRQAAHTYKTIYSNLLNKPFDFSLLEKHPKIEEEKPEILEKSEIIELLNNTADLRYQLFFALMYSAGITFGEAKELKIKDFDFVNNTITIRSKTVQSTRKTELSTFVEKKLQEFIKQYKIKNYLFESNTKGRLLDDSTIQKAFQKAVIKAGIQKQVTPKTLKYSYVKHVEEDGVPLPALMKHLNMVFKWRSRTMWFYSKIVERDVSIIHNPLDKLIYSDIEKLNLVSIERMLLKVSDVNAKDFILEGIQCIKSGVYRAAVIFIWSAVMFTIYQKCLKEDKNDLNKALKKYYRDAPQINSIEDFAYIKDRVVLEATAELSIYDKNSKNVLIECLDLRNKCGHPSVYKPKPIRVAAFLEDIVNIVFSNV